MFLLVVRVTCFTLNSNPDISAVKAWRLDNVPSG